MTAAADPLSDNTETPTDEVIADETLEVTEGASDTDDGTAPAVPDETAAEVTVELVEDDDATTDAAAEDPPVDSEPTAEDSAAETAAENDPAPETSAKPEPAVQAPATPTAPRPMPTPGPRAPLPRPSAGAPRPPAAPSAAATPSEPWGRVEDDGTVSVREGEDWRVVGQYPDGSPAEALAYFERKYADLASEITLIEVRHRNGGASASDLRATAKTVREKVTGAAAVGDLARLERRLDALTEELAAESATEATAAKEAVAAAVRQRTEIVEKAEALAAREPRTIQWKQTSAEITALFDEWQSQQQNGPRLPKSTAQSLWKRFRDARGILDKHRREFYAELDGEHKAVRDRKTRLVEKAEALAPRGEDGIGAYRDLLDEWKTSGRAGKKADDALWARFKAAGDALYSARGEREAADVEESREKIEAKRALLVEASAVPKESDTAKARASLTAIQRRWDEIGRIFPRDKERALDDELRKIETTVRGREDTDWKRNNPETKARTNDMTRQLTDAIEKLEDELAAAQKAGDKKAVAAATEALDARRAWLKVVGG